MSKEFSMEEAENSFVERNIYMDYYKKCKIIRHDSFKDFVISKKKKRIKICNLFAIFGLYLLI